MMNEKSGQVISRVQITRCSTLSEMVQRADDAQAAQAQGGFQSSI